MVDFSLLFINESLLLETAHWEGTQISLPSKSAYIHLKKSVTGLGVLCVRDYQSGQLSLQQFSPEEAMLLLEFISSGNI